jgi:hypothetical protein
VERSIGLAFTTLIIDLASLAHAAHPTQAVKPDGDQDQKMNMPDS